MGSGKAAVQAAGGSSRILTIATPSRWPVSGLRQMLVPVSDVAALAQLSLIASDIAAISYRFGVDTI